MNRYLFIHRIKGPVMIVVFGITALLDQWGILSWSQSWPLYLIAFGLLQLAERAAWSQMQGPPVGPWGAPVGAAPQPGVPSTYVPGSTALSVPPVAGPQDEGRR